jgi:hypothetical protein
MRGSRPLNAWSYALLSLTLLVANILAPFRTSSIGRTILEILSHNVVNDSVVRVRAVTPVATSVGHRAVVGVAGGGRDVADTGTRSHAFSTFVPTPTDASPRQPAARPGTRPTPPLRC